MAASRRIRAPSESLRWGNKGIHRGGRGGALVRWIWGPQQKHQAKSGGRVWEMWRWDWRLSQRSCSWALCSCQALMQERRGVGGFLVRGGR